MNYYELQRAESLGPLENLPYQYLAHLNGLSESAANLAGYCRAELINQLTNNFQKSN